MTKTLDNKSSMCDWQLATCYLLVKSMYSCYYMCEYLPVKWEHVFDCLIEKVYQLQFNDKVCLTCVRKKYFQLFLSHRVCLTSVFCFCYPQTSFRLKSTLNMCKRKERCGRQQLFLTNLSHRLQWYFLIKKCLSVCGKCFTFLTSSEPQMFPEEVLYLFWVIQIPWWPLCLAYDWPRHLLPFQNYWMSSHQTCTNNLERVGIQMATLASLAETTVTFIPRHQNCQNFYPLRVLLFWREILNITWLTYFV